jgi:LuxR family transcriptional regulator, regulator of acetate metabolism
LTEQTEQTDMYRALKRLRRASGLPVAFGGLLGDAHGFRISEMTGTTTGALRGLAISAGSGLGGKAITLAKPVSVTDYQQSRTISHEYDTAVAGEGLCSVLAVPVVVSRKVRAVLYAALRQPMAIGDRPLTAAVLAARELERELAARDEAERLLAAAPAAWEEVRAAHADLRALAHHVNDHTLRRDLLAACARLETACGRPVPDAAAVDLTPRETDVLSAVASGATNATVASRLGLRPETVKAYLRSAMSKLGAHTRLEAVVAARKAGLLP